MHSVDYCCIIRYIFGKIVRGVVAISIMDYLYPPRCPVCGGVTVPKCKPVCDKCKEVFHVIKEPKCMKCGKALEQMEQQYCSDCSRSKQEFTRGFALWMYDRGVRQSIADFKFNNRREYISYYVEEMITYYADIIKQVKPDVYIPVPLHKAKLRKRGYNQAELLARGLSEYTGIKVDNECIERRKNTTAQKSLSDSQRVDNLVDAFQIHKKYKKGTYHKVMLVDDIYTTGSTINACSKVLKQVGVQEVYFICLSIGKGY